MNNTLSGNGEVLILQGFVVLDLDKVVRAELVAWDWLSLAIDELDWSVVAVLGEERDGLLTSLNLLQELPDVGSLADVVGLSSLHHLVLSFVISLLDDVTQAFKGDSCVFCAFFVHTLVVFHLFHLFVGLAVHFHVVHHLVFWVLFDALWVRTSLARERRKLGGVDDSRGSLALTALTGLLCSTGASWTLGTSWLLVGEHWK
jgi:hypothetical protein